MQTYMYRYPSYIYIYIYTYMEDRVDFGVMECCAAGVRHVLNRDWRLRETGAGGLGALARHI